MVIVILIDSFFCGFNVELEYRRKEEKLIIVSICRLRLIIGSFFWNNKISIEGKKELGV